MHRPPASNERRRGRGLFKGPRKSSSSGDLSDMANAVGQPDPFEDMANGVPKWENPVKENGGPGSPVKVSSSTPPTKSSSGRSSQERQSSVGKGSKHSALAGHISRGGSQRPNHRPEPLLPASERIKYNAEETQDFENMVIQYDDTDSEGSFGDITYDESVVNDEAFHRTSHNYRRNPSSANAPRQRSHLHHYQSSPPRAPRRHPSVRDRSNIIPPDDRRYAENRTGLDNMEDAEQRLVDIAMERSMQELNFSPQNSPTRSSRNYQSKTDLGGAGCHLSMIGAHRVQNNSNGPPSEAGPNFIWKREGKKWLKIPINSADNLGSIHEDEADLSQMRQMRNYPDSTETQRLEQLEKKMLEEAMHRSMSDFGNMSSNDFGNNDYGRSSGGVGHNSFGSLHQISEDLDGPPSVTDMSVSTAGRSGGAAPVPEIDPELARLRLSQLEQEKKLLERAMQRSTHSDASVGSSRGGRARPDFNRSYSMRSTGTQESGLTGAGCHLAMIGRSSRTISSNGSSEEGGERPGITRDRHGRKLVWKRGPNNRWGRFPEGDDDVGANHNQGSNNEDEDRLVAEALQRSLNDR